MSLTLTRPAAGLALLAALVAGCGTAVAAHHAASNPATSNPAASSPAAAAHHHGPAMMHAAPVPAVVHHHHARPMHHAAATPAASPATAPAQPTNTIPQGNGGDQDADNNGGPSDGDGNI
jgi:hypothetical protein